MSTKVCIVKAMVFLVAMFDVRVEPQRRLSAEELMLFNKLSRFVMNFLPSVEFI